MKVEDLERELSADDLHRVLDKLVQKGLIIRFVNGEGEPAVRLTELGKAVGLAIRVH